MTEDTRLLALLRSELPPVVPVRPPRDTWRRVVERNHRRGEWSWLDLAVAAAAAAFLLLRPDLLVVLAYHL